MQTHFWDRLYKNVLKPMPGKKNCARIIFSIILILKVLEKNLYFISFAIGTSIVFPEDFISLTLFSSNFFFLTVIYYVGNFRGYSLQLELLD